MLSAVPSSGIVNSVIRITGIGDHDRPEWLIRISGIRTREREPQERQLVDEWLALAGDVPGAYVSGRKSDDPALYRRIVTSMGADDLPTHLIRASAGLRLWLKMTVAREMRLEMYATLAAALNSIRRVLD